MSRMDPWEVIEQALPRLKPKRNREWLAAQLGRPVPNEPLRKMESLFAVLA